MKIIRFISILCLVSTQSIYAENNNRGSFFFELTYGEGLSYPNAKPYKYDPNAMNKENSYNNLDNSIGNYIWNTGTETDKAASLYAFDHSPKPKVTGQNYSFLFEYVFKNGIGLGANVNSADFQGSNLTFSRDLVMLGVIALDDTYGNGNLTQNELKNIQINSPYYTYHQNDLLKMRTYGLNVAYHFLENSSFDPYVRFGLAYGNETTGNAKVVQSTVSVGARYIFGQNFYLLVELSGNNYDGYSKATGNFGQYFGGKEGYSWTLQEYTGKVGVGVKL
ncbi:hypothetical protein EHQ52_03670 [Leptospira koniambonensis]|uniref:Porin n=1 Tax=Leptospira koniambonensis TaxID=2484950 RepID=A0A4R9JC53_9LEPT|nr:hypothetical protein [Leptospira koniambonensis]TGL36980.1 hypothetical protein EHQ52_03670 [Leptospira koniambonensis]